MHVVHPVSVCQDYLGVMMEEVELSDRPLHEVAQDEEEEEEDSFFLVNAPGSPQPAATNTTNTTAAPQRQQPHHNRVLQPQPPSREQIRAYLRSLQDEFSRLLSAKQREEEAEGEGQGNDDDDEDGGGVVALSDLDYIVKQGRLELVQDYCLLGHSGEVTEVTVPLAIRHGGASAAALVAFLVRPPQDAPVTGTAVLHALQWTRDHQGCMAVLEALFLSGGRVPVLVGEGDQHQQRPSPIDLVLTTPEPFTPDRRGLASFLMEQSPGYRPTLASYLPPVREADMQQLAWLKQVGGGLSLSEVEEASGAAKGTIIKQALEARLLPLLSQQHPQGGSTGMMSVVELLEWLVEEGGASLPEQLDADVYKTLVKARQLGMLEWLAARGLEADHHDPLLVHMAITNTNSSRWEEEEEEVMRQQQLAVVSWLLDRGYSVDGPAAMKALLLMRGGDEVAGAAKEQGQQQHRGLAAATLMLRCLIKARPGCLDTPTITIEMKAPALAVGVKVQTKERRQTTATTSPQHHHHHHRITFRPPYGHTTTPAAPLLQQPRDATATATSNTSGGAPPGSSTNTSGGGRPAALVLGGGRKGRLQSSWAGKGHVLSSTTSSTTATGGEQEEKEEEEQQVELVQQPLRRGVVIEASSNWVKVRWEDMWVETLSLSAFQHTVEVVPVATPSPGVQAGRPYYLHHCLTRWLALPLGSAEGGHMLHMAKTILGDNLEHLSVESWELVLGHPRAYAAIVAPLVHTPPTTTTTTTTDGTTTSSNDGGRKGVVVLSLVEMIRRAPSSGIGGGGVMMMAAAESE